MDTREALFSGEDSTRGAERLVASGDATGATLSIPVSAADGSSGTAALDGLNGSFSYKTSKVGMTERIRHA